MLIGLRFILCFFQLHNCFCSYSKLFKYVNFFGFSGESYYLLWSQIFSIKIFFSLIHFCLNLALEDRSSTAYVQLIELCLWATLQQQCTYRTQFSYIFLFINFDLDMLFIFRVAQKEQDLPYQSQYLFLRFPAAVILFLSLQNHIERLHQSQEIILKDYTRFRKSY